MINGKKEDRICGYGPPLSFYLEEDHELTEKRAQIFYLIKSNYDAAMIYIKRLEFIREFFAVDTSTEAATIQAERSKAYYLNINIFVN